MAFAICIFAQWLFIAGLPVVRPKRYWLEPSILLLAFGAAGALLTTFEQRSDLYWLPPMFAALVTWFVWFGFVLRSGLQWSWRRIR